MRSKGIELQIRTERNGRNVFGRLLYLGRHGLLLEVEGATLDKDEASNREYAKVRPVSDSFGLSDDQKKLLEEWWENYGSLRLPPSAKGELQ